MATLPLREKAILETLSKLRFLAKIRTGEKIDVPNLTVSEDSWRTRLYRTFFSGQSRQSTYALIEETFEIASSLAKECKSSPDEHSLSYFSMLIESMKEASCGCANLMGTYSTDRMYIASLETLLDTVNVKISALEATSEN